MGHIHTEPGQYDFTVSAHIVRLDLPEPSVLMHQHRILKKWLQFGGHVELHENPWQAIKHELIEESGYDISQLQLLQPDTKAVTYTDAILHPTPVAVVSVKFGELDHFHTDIVYAFTTSESPAEKVGENESDNIRAFTIKDLQALTDDEIPKNVRELAIRILKEYLKTWHSIPTDVWK